MLALTGLRCISVMVEITMQKQWQEVTSAFASEVLMLWLMVQTQVRRSVIKSPFTVRGLCWPTVFLPASLVLSSESAQICSPGFQII